MTIAASIRQRLKNAADQAGRPFNQVLQHYGLERWLYRLSRSVHAERLILKGAMLLLAEELPLSRPTRDLDFLAKMSNDLEAVRAVIAEVSSTEVEDDGLHFDAKSVQTERISMGARYEGVCAIVRGQLGTARVVVRIDLGFSDVITPGPRRLVYPTLLDLPAPQLLGYSLESAIAEKVESMVTLGEINSRMKDFFDVWALSRTHVFERSVLKAAIERTFERRGSELEAAKVFLSSDFASRPRVGEEWQSYVKRTGLDDVAPASLGELWGRLREFVEPVFGDEGAGASWSPTRGWESGGG